MDSWSSKVIRNLFMSQNYYTPHRHIMVEVGTLICFGIDPTWNWNWTPKCNYSRNP
jgi:hypothetical protein